MLPYTRDVNTRAGGVSTVFKFRFSLRLPFVFTKSAKIHNFAIANSEF